MRKALLVLAFCGFAASLSAADAFVGTWKIDIAQSKLAAFRGPIPKESILVIVEKGTDRESYNKDTYTDGSSVLTKWTVPAQGGTVKFQQTAPGTRGDTSIVTRISGGEDYWTLLEKGKQIEVGHWTVSKDGKTIRGVRKGIDPQGKPYEELIVGARQ